MTPVIAVLGAGDHEMTACKQLLTGVGISYVSGMVLRDNRAEHAKPDTAYEINDIFERVSLSDKHILRIECGGPVFDGIDPARITVIDHHRPGDPGYDTPAADFVAGSSVGQLYSWIHQVQFQYHKGSKCWLAVRADGLSWRAPLFDVVYPAAADHCLAAAYAGLCPGVRPGTMKEFRLHQKAEYRCKNATPVITEAECRLQVAKDFDDALQFIHKRTKSVAGDVYGDPSSSMAVAEIAENEGLVVPREVNEAAAFLGVTLIRPQPHYVPRGVQVFSRSEEMIRAFLHGRIYAGLRHRYGCPKRGYAGGYY